MCPHPAMAGKSAAYPSPSTRDHRRWRAGVCPPAAISRTGSRNRHQICFPGRSCQHSRRQDDCIFLKCHDSFPCTGISPMHSIGRMERFQPFPSGWRCLPDARTPRRKPRGPALSDFRPAQAAASMTAPWDPRPEIRGDVDRRLTEEMPQKAHKMQMAKSKGFRAFQRH